MAIVNTLGIYEVSLAQLKLASAPVNTLGNTAQTDVSLGNVRVVKEALNPAIVRVIDHPADDGAATTDVSKMALFTSKAHLGEWILGGANQGMHTDDETFSPA